MPSRLPTTFLIYRGDTLLMVAKRGGREIELRGQTPDRETLVFFRERLQRRVRPLRRVEIEMIDGAPARESEHGHAFLDFGFRPDRRNLVLERSY